MNLTAVGDLAMHLVARAGLPRYAHHRLRPLSGVCKTLMGGHFMRNCMIWCVVLLGIAGSAYSETPKPAEQGKTSQEANPSGTDKILENNGKLDLHTEIGRASCKARV